MDIRDACAEMFRRHRVAAFGGVFHVPDVEQYNCLFAWDSGYHALALRRLDADAARTELSTLYSANTAPDGLLAHERPAPGAGARTFIITEALGPIYRPDGRSWLIDPPVAAYAAAKIADAARPEDIALLEAAAAHLDAIDRLRTIDGLPVILSPFESGTDASPIFDSLFDLSSPTAALRHLRGLAVSLARLAYSLPAAITAKHPFIVSEPVFCSWHLLALEEMADAWARMGDVKKAAAASRRADALCEAMATRMWCEEFGLFVGFDHVGQRQLSAPTVGGVIAAASRCMVERGFGARLLPLLRPDTSPFWGRSGLSFNPVRGALPNAGGLLWRGDVVSGATHYWANLAFVRNGQAELADCARDELERLIAESGFREFYDASSGAGVGAGAKAGFTWPALVLDMAAGEIA